MDLRSDRNFFFPLAPIAHASMTTRDRFKFGKRFLGSMLVTRISFLVGISAIAFAASGASAQMNSNTVDGNGNKRVIDCQVGANNTCNVTNQTAGNTNDTGSVGARNGSNNTGNVVQSGNRLYGVVDLNGSFNSGTIDQVGNNNTGFIFQTGSNGSDNTNTGSITQRNNDNSATITQTRTGTAGVGNNNSSTINQGVTIAGGVTTQGLAQNNVASSTQNGKSLRSTITQNSTTGVAASSNTATVSQTGDGSTSSVTQSSRGNTAMVSLSGGGVAAAGGATTAANDSTITQNNTMFQQDGTNTDSFVLGAPTATNNPLSRNVADVAIAGSQNSSTVGQDGVQNTTNQTILGGGPGSTQANAKNPGTGVTLTAGQIQGNVSSVTQSGRGNYAATSIGGSTPTTAAGSGNSSTITQTQGSASVTQTTLNSAVTASTAHRALVYQRGTLDVAQITQTNQGFTGGATGVQSGSTADVSQLSFQSTASVTQAGTNTAIVSQGASQGTSASDVVTINQTDAGDLPGNTTPGGIFGGGSAGTAVPAKNFVEVAQGGIQNTSTVTQNAVNASATTFQALGSRANLIRIQQGNGQTATGASTQQTTADGMAATNQMAAAQNLTARVDQSGQAGQGAQMTVVTAAGTFTPITGLNRGVDISQNGQNLTAKATQSGGTATAAGTTLSDTRSSNNGIAIAQSNSNSSATVGQSGTNLSALVEQRSQNATAALLSLVTIDQTGDSNRAIARQTQGAGASPSNAVAAGQAGDPGFRSGAQSAEAVIRQSGSRNSATIEQRDRGQYALIDQRGGSGNTGGILQDTGAVNAVAMLTQSGTNNTYYITQNTAGQYINVSQTGDTNAMTTVTERSSQGNGTGGGGTTSTTLSPTFGGTQ